MPTNKASYFTRKVNIHFIRMNMPDDLPHAKSWVSDNTAQCKEEVGGISKSFHYSTTSKNEIPTTEPFPFMDNLSPVKLVVFWNNAIFLMVH